MTSGHIGTLEEPRLLFFAWHGWHGAGTRAQQKDTKGNGVLWWSQEEPPLVGGLSSDTKATSQSWLPQLLLLQSIPFTRTNLQILISNSGLIRPWYNSFLKGGGGQHPHRTKLEVLNLKKYCGIKKWGDGEKEMQRPGKGDG